MYLTKIISVIEDTNCMLRYAETQALNTKLKEKVDFVTNHEITRFTR